MYLAPSPSGVDEKGSFHCQIKTSKAGKVCCHKIDGLLKTSFFKMFFKQLSKLSSPVHSIFKL